jgi:hypothetical protein
MSAYQTRTILSYCREAVFWPAYLMFSKITLVPMPAVSAASYFYVLVI